jgi:hypothetical protein
MREKYQEEIEEILRKAGEAAPGQTAKNAEGHPEDRPSQPLASRQAPGPGAHTRKGRPAITPGKLMLAGLVVFLIGIKLWPLIWVGLALLVGAYLLYFVSPKSVNYEKRWRGRSMEDDPGSYWGRLKRWLRN